jgi:hypothetical protein
MEYPHALDWARFAMWENRGAILDDYVMHDDECPMLKCHLAFLTLVHWTMAELLEADLLGKPEMLPGYACWSQL